MRKLSDYSMLLKRTPHNQLRSRVVRADVAIHRYKSKYNVLNIARKDKLFAKNRKLLDFIAEDVGHPLNCISDINYKISIFCKNNII